MSDLHLSTSRDAVSWLRTLARGDADSLPLGMSSPEGSGPTPPAAAALRMLTAIDKLARTSALSALAGVDVAAEPSVEPSPREDMQAARKAPLAHTSRISMPDGIASSLHVPAASPEDQPVVSVVLKVNEHVLPFLNAATIQPSGTAGGSRGEGSGLYQVCDGMGVDPIVWMVVEFLPNRVIGLSSIKL